MPRLRRSLEFVATLGLVALLSTCSLPLDNSDEDPEPTPVADPVAEASWSGTPMIGHTLTFDGSQSKNARAYHWTMESFPAGSAAFIVNSFDQKPTFTPDRAGTHVFKLTVSNNGLQASKTLTIEVAAEPQTVFADGSYTGIRKVGELLTFDASTSIGAASYLWTVETAPEGSLAVISNPTSVSPTFRPDKAGTYTFQLEARSASGAQSSTKLLTAEIDPLDPVALPTIVASITGTGNLGSKLTIDATGTTGADSIQMEMVSYPQGADTYLNYTSSTIRYFYPDVAGTYEVKITATNAGGTAVKTLSKTVVGPGSITIIVQ